MLNDYSTHITELYVVIKVQTSNTLVQTLNVTLPL